MEAMDRYPSHPARDVSVRSMTAVESGDREGWLSLFTEDSVVEEAVVTVVDALFLPPPDPHATSTSKAATVAINGFTAGGYPPAAVPARLTSTPNMRCAMRRIWISSEPSVMR